MKIVIPMAGMGKRMRPHSLTIPKPLIPVAGKPIVEHLVEDIVQLSDEKVDEIAFVIGRFGKQVEESLKKVAEHQGAKASIYYQDEALGTAHAILCAEKSLSGKTVVAFADTLFRCEEKFDSNCDGIIWVNQIDDPSAFGVVKVDGKNVITDFVEKPTEFVSDLAIIGIYYFKDGENLKKELQYLIDNDIKDKGEYQITNALENMTANGKKLQAGKVQEWLDCGNKNATVYTNQRVLEIKKRNYKIPSSIKQKHAVIIEPCSIGENVEITHSIIGPHVSVGANTKVDNSVIQNSIIQENSNVSNACISNSMIGNYVTVNRAAEDLSIGDFSVSEE
ncbi:MAG: NTP transferase domain-containing protein [Bacteroidia bacterium]|nr:NTP transferase domain-containing protein [Bacteroidia bacterium]